MIRSVLTASAIVLVAGTASALAEERVVFESEAFAELSTEERVEIVQILIDNDLLPEDGILTVPDSASFNAFELQSLESLATARPLATWSGLLDEVTVSSAQAAGTSACISTCTSLETTALAACSVMKGTQYVACLAAVFAGAAVCRAGCWIILD